MRMNRRDRGLLAIGAAVCLGTLSMGDVLDSSYTQMAMFGIDRVGSYLVRYDFNTGVVTEVGQVRDKSGNLLEGIEASAYIPGFTNIYGFWQDPADGQSKLIYINTSTASAAVVGNPLGDDPVTGAVAAAGNNGWEVFAIQQPAEPALGFEIEGGRVIPDGEFAVKVTVLGADISYGGQYEEPVTVRLRVGGSTFEPFGAFDQAVSGNIHDHTVHHAVLSGTFAAGDNVSVIGRNWIKKKSWYNGTSNAHWEERGTVTSTDDVPEVIVLRNGDDVPNIEPFLDQAEIVDFIEDYVDFDTNKVAIGANQAIYLFELGSGGASSSSADFQDLVVLITLASSEDALLVAEGVEGELSGELNINPNNSPDNEFTLEKPDGTTLTRDDLHDGAGIDENGVIYSGPADLIKVKPKGSGNQNTMMVDGASFAVSNANLYSIVAGDDGMTVTIYNDNINGSGIPMGHWWIDFTGGEGTVYEGDPPTPDSGESGRLIKVDHKTGAVTEVMTLVNRYDSLASEDGAVFYASGGGGLYLIDTTAGTETLVGAIPGTTVDAMEYAGTTIMAFDSTEDHMVPVDSGTAAALGSPASLGMDDLGTIVFMDLADDPGAIGHSFD